MNTYKNIAALALIALAFSGCAKMIDATFDGVAYTANSITGIDYPMKKGKIYIESTTLEDTKNINEDTAQNNGFDSEVIKNTLQCDSRPELIDVLTSHGWEITSDKSLADYQVSVSTVYCGYASIWLEKANRLIDMDDRRVHTVDVSKLPQYNNVFAYKYNEAPEHIQKIAGLIKSGTKLEDDKTGNSASAGIIAGSNASSAGNVKGGAAIAGVGIAMSLLSSKGPSYSGYLTEVVIYDPLTKKSSTKYFDGLLDVSKVTGIYKDVRFDAESFGSGLFYK